MPARAKNWPRPWLFLVLILPGGIFGTGFVTTPLPYLLGKSGVPVDKIAGIGSLLYIPAVFYFFWSPIVDMNLRRRTWLVLVSFLSAGCFGAAIPFIGTKHLALMTGILVLGMVINCLVSSAQGGLMVSTLSPEDQARASGWTQAGNLGGGAIGAAITLWLLGRLPIPIAAAAAAGMTAFPSLAALTIAEPAPSASAGFMDRINKIGRDLLAALRSRRTLLGLLLLAAPVGSGAALNLLPAVAAAYHVGEQGVVWVNGVAGGLVLALGSLLATPLPANWDRRVTYAGAGLLNALASITLMSGLRPEIYFTGTVLYLLTTGFCYARFLALVMDILGPGEHGKSTRYSLFLAAGNLPIAYVLALDGLGYRHFGTRGLFAVDAAGNLLVFAILAGACLAQTAKSEPLVPGTPAPEFALPDQSGNLVKLSALRGKHVVMVFYPGDNTPGCTRQMCELRDNWETVSSRGVLVFGVNPQKAKSHESFRRKFQLPFPLLVDKGRQVARLYHADGLIVKRTVYLIGPDGVIRFAQRGMPKPSEVLAACDEPI